MDQYAESDARGSQASSGVYDLGLNIALVAELVCTADPIAYRSLFAVSAEVNKGALAAFKNPRNPSELPVDRAMRLLLQPWVMNMKLATTHPDMLILVTKQNQEHDYGYFHDVDDAKSCYVINTRYEAHIAENFCRVHPGIAEFLTRDEGIFNEFRGVAWCDGVEKLFCGDFVYTIVTDFPRYQGVIAIDDIPKDIDTILGYIYKLTSAGTTQNVSLILTCFKAMAGLHDPATRIQAIAKIIDDFAGRASPLLSLTICNMAHDPDFLRVLELLKPRSLSIAFSFIPVVSAWRDELLKATRLLEKRYREHIREGWGRFDESKLCESATPDEQGRVRANDYTGMPRHFLDQHRWVMIASILGGSMYEYDIPWMTVMTEPSTPDIPAEVLEKFKARRADLQGAEDGRLELDIGHWYNDHPGGALWRMPSFAAGIKIEGDSRNPMRDFIDGIVSKYCSDETPDEVLADWSDRISIEWRDRPEINGLAEFGSGAVKFLAAYGSDRVGELVEMIHELAAYDPSVLKLGAGFKSTTVIECIDLNCLDGKPGIVLPR